MTIGVVTVAYGEPYQRFIPAWAQSVASLTVQPDHAVIICDSISAEHLDILERTLDSTRTTVMLTKTTPEYHPQILVNEAIAALETDWVCKMDIDDRFLPHALDKVPDCTSDVLMFGIMLTQWDSEGNEVNRRPVFMLPQHVDAKQIAVSPHNLVFSGSPFRHHVWQAAPFRDMIYEDWAFWIEAAKNGFTFTQTGSIDYEYRVHGSNVSMLCDDARWRRQVLDLQ